jgi:hypothetical protein
MNYIFDNIEMEGNIDLNTSLNGRKLQRRDWRGH